MRLRIIRGRSTMLELNIMKFSTLTIALLVSAAPVAQAEIVLFRADLAPESAGATGSGTVELAWNDLLHTLTIDADWTGLSGITTQAHIHCCTAAPGTGNAGVAVTPGTLPSFPTGVTSGSYATTLDLTVASTYLPAFLTASGGTAASSEARLIQGFYDGTAYFNIHTSTFGGGEIRGFLEPVVAAVPEPSTLALMLLGLAASGAVARRRR